MIVAICGQKGGTGKSTTAVSIAVAWVERGHRVLLVDLDPQGTVQTWGDVAAEAGSAHVPTVVTLGAALHYHLPPLAAAHDLVVIDCPPRHGEMQAAALMVATVAVLPCSADPSEVWGMTASTDLVRNAQATRPALVARLLVTRKDRRTAIGTGARRALERLELPVLDAELSRRVTYPEALAFGKGPTTHEPKSDAAREVRRLASELGALLGLRDAKPMRARP